MKKNYYVIFSIVLLISVLIGSYLYFNNRTTNRITVEQLLKDHPIYFVDTNFEKTLKLDSVGGTPIVIAPVAGVISPDLSQIAFTKWREETNLDNNLYIYDLDEKMEKYSINISSIPTSDCCFPPYVSAWSEDMKYLLTQTNSGINIISILDLENKEEIFSKSIIGNADKFFKDNSIVYTHRLKNGDSGLYQYSITDETEKAVYIEKGNLFNIMFSNISNSNITLKKRVIEGISEVVSTEYIEVNLENNNNKSISGKEFELIDDYLKNNYGDLSIATNHYSLDNVDDWRIINFLGEKNDQIAIYNIKDIESTFQILGEGKYVTWY